MRRDWIRGLLPQGRRLPERDWAARHRVILVVMVGHAIGIFCYALSRGNDPNRCALDAAPVALLTLVAASPSVPRRVRSCLATLAALGSSAILVQVSGGLIEAHFHFFVMIILVTVYQDWLTFLLAAAFVVVEHAVVGVIAPHSVYDHSDAWHHPVKWAVIHGLFVAGAAACAVANWKLTEKAQARERAIADKLAYEAAHDSLTGALSRREFDRRLAARLAGQPAADTRDVLCFLDLDRFKIVNDSAGHAAGDVLLREVAGLLRTGLGDGDLLGRIGGDEFAVLLVDRRLEDATSYAERVRTDIADCRFALGGRVFVVGVSIGVVAVTAQLRGDEGREAVRAADAACYVAKDKGRNRVHVGSSKLAHQQGQVQWAERLMTAIQSDDLMLYYQPIAPVSGSGGAFGELLLRMRIEDGSAIAPGAFLPAAERYDLVGAIDRWVVEAAFAAIAGRFALLDAVPQELFSINLSGRSVGDDSFMIHIRDLFDRYAVPPRAVCFEVTETVAISDLAEATAFITELRSLGCRFALDDFGSGLSSFTYLKRLPVDFVKIDGNFVRDITTDTVDRAMVESVNRISHEMGLRTVAEFVETDATMRVLRLIGVDYAQGWAIGRPEPFDEWSSRTTALAPSAGSASR